MVGQFAAAVVALCTAAVAQDLFLQPAQSSKTDPSALMKGVRGVALNGLLEFEDWFFSWAQGLPPAIPYPFDEVSSGPTLPQGRRFPSDVIAPELIDPWLSEGGLLGTTASRLGNKTTIDAVTVHRETYITEFDFAHMAAQGIKQVRLAAGWWVFASNPSSVKSPELISDLCYPELQFVTVQGTYLVTLLQQAARYDVSILFDLHSMPCGSSDGTYNGVFPADPAFFRNEKARKFGLQVVRNMMEWWAALPKDLQAACHGFTVLNEPALGLVLGGSGGGAHLRPGVTPLPGGNVSVVAWLKEAVKIFVDIAVTDNAAPPLLYMNLHEAAFPESNTTQSSIIQMASAFTEMGLANKSWAVYDVHHYFAWSEGNGIPAENCSTDAELVEYVRKGMFDFTTAMQNAASQYNIANIACSEWSLSLHHKDHISPCTAPSSLDLMHDLQIKAFKDSGMGHFFWGWRMPTGGVHEPMWSLKYHYTGMH